jgi:hypothetical protein
MAQGSVWPARLIIVDQGADTTAAESSVARLRQRGMDVEHILAAANGISSATNLGLRHVRTTFAAVTHDDCRVRTDWLHRAALRLNDIGDAILTGRVEPEGDGIVLTVNLADEATTYRSPLMAGDVLFPPNMALAVRLIERIGWFDEHPSLATARSSSQGMRSWRQARSATRAMRPGAAPCSAAPASHSTTIMEASTAKPLAGSGTVDGKGSNVARDWPGFINQD